MTGSASDAKTAEGERSGRRPSRLVRRIRTHVAVGAGSLAATAFLFALVQSDDAVFRASMATAYVALALLAVTLLFGPITALRGHRYPLSTDLRRDFGIWSGILAVAHVVVGLQVHMRGKMWEYFAHESKGMMLPRFDPFGLANYTGLGATLILVVLLVTSNDASLRRLGAERWRKVHALASWGLVLTVLHGAAYQAIEKRVWAFVLVFVLLAIPTAALRIRERRYSPRGDQI